MGEFKVGPPYACKLIRPSKGKTVKEPKNDASSTKTYTFDVSKYDEIFDVLISDGQIIVPPGPKDPPLEKKQKISFCKYHNFLGHNTSQCFLFRDLTQKALKEG